MSQLDHGDLMLCCELRMQKMLDKEYKVEPTELKKKQTCRLVILRPINEYRKKMLEVQQDKKSCCTWRSSWFIFHPSVVGKPRLAY